MIYKEILLQKFDTKAWEDKASFIPGLLVDFMKLPELKRIGYLDHEPNNPYKKKDVSSHMVLKAYIKDRCIYGDIMFYNNDEGTLALELYESKRYKLSISILIKDNKMVKILGFDLIKIA